MHICPVFSNAARNIFLSTQVRNHHCQIERRSLRSDLLWVNVRQDNSGVVAAELQRETFQRVSRASSDEFACGGRAGKRDLLDARVSGDPWSSKAM